VKWSTTASERQITPKLESILAVVRATPSNTFEQINPQLFEQYSYSLHTDGRRNRDEYSTSSSQAIRADNGHIFDPWPTCPIKQPTHMTMTHDLCDLSRFLDPLTHTHYSAGNYVVERQWEVRTRLFIFLYLYELITHYIYTVSQKTGHLIYFQISPTKLDQYQ